MTIVATPCSAVAYVPDTGTSFFTNDLNGKVPLLPARWTINSRNELIGEVAVESLQQWAKDMKITLPVTLFPDKGIRNNPVLLLLKLK